MKRLSSLRLPLIVLLFVYIFLRFFLPLETEDVWWHLATGRWIFEHQQVPHADPFPPFTGIIQPWVFTQWLGSLILYCVYLMGGLWGLIAWRAVIFCAVGGIAFFYARRRMPWPLLVFVIFLLLGCLTRRFVIRPCIYNLIFIQLFLICLFHYQRRGDLRILIWLPVMGIVWANLNLGSFIYGNLLLGIFLLSAMVRGFDLRRRKHINPWRPARELTFVLLTYIAIFGVNPYGLDGFLYPFRVLLDPDFIHFYNFNSVIYEMLSPFENFLIFKVYEFVFLLVLDIMGLIGLWRKAMQEGVQGPGRTLSLTATLLFIFAFGLLFYGMRGMAFFSLVSIYIVFQAAENLNWTSRWQERTIWRRWGMVLQIAMVLILTAKIGKLVNKTMVIDGERCRALTQPLSISNPHAAVDFLITHNISGPLLHDDSTGGYLIWAAYPVLKPFLDGRQLNFPYFVKQMKMFRQPDVYWPLAERDFGFNAVMLDAAMPGQAEFPRFLSRRPEWQLVFIQGSLVVLVKRGLLKLPPTVEAREESWRSATFDRADIIPFERLIAETKKKQRFKFWFDSVPVYFDELEEGITLYDLGFQEAGMARIMRVLEEYPYQYTAAVAKVALQKFRKAGSIEHDMERESGKAGGDSP